MAVIMSPLASGHVQDAPVPVLNYADGPPRCGRCRAYVNPFIRQSNDQNMYFCNFCGARNAMPVDVHNVVDLQHARPELRLCALPRSLRAFSTTSSLSESPYSTSSLSESPYSLHSSSCRVHPVAPLRCALAPRDVVCSCV